ncbi:hypothetical protein ND861_00035 [Leptospira sp. 2 VSF19]|uniref:Uncharacterized protein n=1 Tax=Leptospira soteropolitanensis TaxID=2950025 RepID=A0AAW5V9W3_9LEPT|nr:hypothetical protein [Leptospira soteropolitanensis]MCW7491028.1 hypothetical protein [Leptospira soteropolitanensis]MCW7498612.1 hypothetical protein [Leptospira soteropolitanensis]MCW7521795.1 hypothetical protein [Leptospira soteropolitanensis]MCW7524716.1 hypothetical protein [Leptospira soteropolitanensis]MCW7528583.1 hypothetical protein [Leptospira soteropolitanensis]
MKLLYLACFTYFFNCSHVFELEVKKEVGGTDYILAETACSRYGYRIPVIEELIWADVFGGLNEVRSKMTNIERYAILSSSREGILDFHLGYILQSRETYIFKNTVPVGYGFCIPNHKTIPYHYALISNRIIDYISSKFKKTQFSYIGKGTYKEAGLWCAKISHNEKRILISTDDIGTFRNSSLFKNLFKVGIESFWLIDKTEDFFFHQVYYSFSDRIEVEEDINQEKGIICRSSN